jgi:diacylglycerol kinase family enzyme
MSVALIVNRQAEQLRPTGSRLLAAYARSARGNTVRVYETRSLEELASAADDIRAHAPSIVVLAGGDGSYSAGVTALLRTFGEKDLPAVALAPGGTVSTVARNWGMHGSRVRYVERLLGAVQNGHSSFALRPTLRVNDRTGFIFGAGLVASFFREYYASAYRGSLGAARIVAPIFAGSFVGSDLAKRVLEPVACTLSIDGTPQTARGYSLIAASVVRDLGLHMWVTYRAGEHPDCFHAVASPLGTRNLGPQMPRVLLGKRLRGEHHVDALVRELSIAFESRGAWVLDGDLVEGDRVTVTNGPRIRVVTAP